MDAREDQEGWSEDALHRWLAEQPWPASLVGSRGDDAAVLGEVPGRSVLCADQCVENIHFVRAAGGRAAGRKAVLRALSDLAASAAQPVAVTLTLSAPPRMEGMDAERWIQALLTGANEAAVEHGAELVAGDLAQSHGPIALSVTALGATDPERVPVGRDRGAAGQVILLSGPVGGSLPSGRHLEPLPRIRAGLLAAEAGATAMMDVSDGLAWDLFRMARASGLKAVLDAERVPLHADAASAAQESGRTALDHGLHDGEDHELLASMGPAAWGKFQQTANGAPWCQVGAFQSLEKVGDHLAVLRGGTSSHWRPGPGRGWSYTH